VAEKIKENNVEEPGEEKPEEVKEIEKAEEETEGKEPEDSGKEFKENKEDKERDKESSGKRKRERLSPEEREKRETERQLEEWKPKTKTGRLVMAGKIKNIDEILEKERILETEIVDTLLNLKSDLLAIGQAKGKFGGGKRRAWRQTQKKTKEGNIPTFSSMVVVGNSNGYVGIGYGRAKETLPARAKALRKAKLNIIKIKRGCGSFDCICQEKHSIPFKTEGKCGSSKIVLLPAPQGTGLVAGDEIKKILKLAGIKDIYSKSFGQTKTSFNLAKATINALKKLKKIRK